MNNFKKIVSFVLAFSGMMNVFSVSFAETVQNSAIPGWSVEYADDASGSTAFENGENSDDLAVVINSTGTGICKIKQMVETEPGKKYECSVRVKTKNLSGGYIYAGGQKRDIRDGSNNWSEYKFVFAAENEESEIGVALNNTGSVIVDSFKIKDESGNPIKVANSDFKEEGKSTSSTSVSVSESVDMNKEVLSKEEVPYFYSTQKKVPIFYADNITIELYRDEVLVLSSENIKNSENVAANEGEQTNIVFDLSRNNINISVSDWNTVIRYVTVG